MNELFNFSLFVFFCFVPGTYGRLASKHQIHLFIHLFSIYSTKSDYALFITFRHARPRNIEWLEYMRILNLQISWFARWNEIKIEVLFFKDMLKSIVNTSRYFCFFFLLANSPRNTKCAKLLLRLGFFLHFSYVWEYTDNVRLEVYLLTWKKFNFNRDFRHVFTYNKLLTVIIHVFFVL